MEGRNLVDDKEFLFAFQFAGDKARKAQQRLRKHIFDVEAWNNCLEEVQYRPIHEVRPIYETLVVTFPTCGRYWKFYIEHEMRQKNYESTEKLFQRCLTKVLHIDLWKTYLGYIKETKCTLPSFREKMVQAFEFAVDKVGLDTQSFQVWNDYIKFLNDVPASGSYAESQRIIALRKIYQRSVVIPMVMVEQLWRDYTAFETATNANLAKKIIDEKSREYMNARRVAKEHEVATKGINRNQPAVPFVAGGSSSAEQLRQLRLWKRYINWERANPLQTDDNLALAKRVMYAYEQCLLCLGYYPHVWLEAVAYLQESSRQLSDKGESAMSQLFSDEAANLFERAILELMHDNMLLHFAYADFEEARQNTSRVHEIYRKLLTEPSIDPTLTYVQYMRFARRAEGIKAARQVFKQAREDQRANFHVFVAAANMEYFCTKDSAVAFKIFELGLKRYGSNPDYVIAYLDFMAHLNEDNNTRVLFERILSSGQLPSDKSLEVWNSFLAFESEVGDLPSILKVEKRRLQATLKPGSETWEDTALMIDRYKYSNLYPCTASQMEAIGYRDNDRHSNRSVAAGGDFSTTSSQMANGTSAPTRSTTAAPSTIGAVASGMASASAYRFSMPDTTQMFPFKPKALAPPGSHPVPGGVFPLPPAAARLMQMLPPPTYFHGPFVDVESFCELFKKCELPDESEIQQNVGWAAGRLDPGTKCTVDSMLQSATTPTSVIQQQVSRRRPRLAPGTTDPDQLQLSDEESNSLPALPASLQLAQVPTTTTVAQQPSPQSANSVFFPAISGGDIYRMRQQKKARTELLGSGTS